MALILKVVYLEALKQAIFMALILKVVDLENPFIMEIDVSKVVISARLSQDGQPMAFKSKKLFETQINWLAHEQEMHAIIHVLKT